LGRYHHRSRIKATIASVAIVAFDTRTMDDARYDADCLIPTSADEATIFRYSNIPEDVGPEIMIGKNQKYGEVTLSPAVSNWMYARTTSANTKNRTPPTQIDVLVLCIAACLTDVIFMGYTQCGNVQHLQLAPHQNLLLNPLRQP
jgi:hypothetical protein